MNTVNVAYPQHVFPGFDIELGTELSELHFGDCQVIQGIPHTLVGRSFALDSKEKADRAEGKIRALLAKRGYDTMTGTLIWRSDSLHQ